ncbi:MAG: cytochrome b/b6 domain-containing protein [Thermodesulfobacteriota bacterium]
MSRIRRFTLVQRLFHLLLMLSFLTQAATGLGRMYIETSWGSLVASFFGGYELSLTIHRWVGLFMLSLLGVHIIYVLATIEWRGFPKRLMGPDSLLPHKDDLKQALGHVGWMVGLAPQPRLDRWTYWEKFDYWAVFWGLFILGGTGLLLFNPVASSHILPGWGLNVTLWVHRIEAALAMAHIFIIHFFIGHLRREQFPMDLVMFEGSVDRDKLSHERPAWVERLQREGRLEDLEVPPKPLRWRVAYYIFGYTAMIACLFLFVGALSYSRLVTW